MQAFRKPFPKICQFPCAWRIHESNTDRQDREMYEKMFYYFQKSKTQQVLCDLYIKVNFEAINTENENISETAKRNLGRWYSGTRLTR